MFSKTLATLVVSAGLAVSAAACTPTHTSDAKALASSTAGQTVKHDAKTMLAGCMPATAGQTSLLAWESALKRCDIPKGKRFATAKCIAAKLSTATLPPKGDARNTFIVNVADTCIKANQAK